MIVVIIGFTMGISIVTARFVGAKNTLYVKNTIATACMVSVILSVLLATLGSLFAERVLRALNTPEDIIAGARIYLITNFSTCIGPIAYNMFANIIRSIGDSRSPLNALIISSLLNVVLDLVFVLVFDWDVMGVALATGISQIVSAAYCISVLYQKHHTYWFGRAHLRFHGKILLDILKFGTPMAAGSLFTSIGGMFVQRMINAYGTTVVAGYTAATKMEQIALQAIMSVGSALSTYAGQNFGAGRADRVRQGVRAAWKIGLVVSVAFGFTLFFLGKWIALLFVSAKEAEVIAVAAGFMRIISPCLIIGSGMYLYMNAMRGMGEIAVPMMTGLAELGAKILAAWLLSMSFGYKTMWFAWPIGWACALVLLLVYYHGFLWKRPRYAALLRPIEASETA